MKQCQLFQIKWISDAISSRDNILPQQPIRPGTAMILAYVQEIISNKSVGIGLPGIFVINFKITLSVSHIKHNAYLFP